MKNESGQVLLIITMLLAVVITVVLTQSFTSRTETQLTKLEEDNQKALAAAEAGIEAALKSSSTVVLNTLPGLANFSGSASASLITENDASFVTSQSVNTTKTLGSQFSFYLTSWSFENDAFTPGGSYNGDIFVYYGDGSQNSQVNCDATTLEITIISGTGSNYSIDRKIADTGKVLGGEEIGLQRKTTGNPSTRDPVNVDETFFWCQTDTNPNPNRIDPIDLPANTKLMLVRVIRGDTKLGFVGTSGDLPSQGRTITSEAITQTGVKKKVQLLQSNPQIPAELFVTSFTNP